MSLLLFGTEVPAEAVSDKGHADAPGGLFSCFGQLLELLYQYIILSHNTVTVTVIALLTKAK